jgi:hypothetical protein
MQARSRQGRLLMRWLIAKYFAGLMEHHKLQQLNYLY